MSGFHVAILGHDDEELDPGEIGLLAITIAHWPQFWTEGFFENVEERGRRFTRDRRFSRSGDSASQDSDGYITFAGHDDDLINRAWYRVGPLEVESVLIAHPAVAAAAVVGTPGPLRGEVVRGFVGLRWDVVPSGALTEELGRIVKRHRAAHALPRDLTVLDALSKAPSGKIQRFLPRQQTSAVLDAPAGRLTLTPGSAAVQADR